MSFGKGAWLMYALLMLLGPGAGPLNGPLPPGAIAQLGTFEPNCRTGVTSAAFSNDGSHVLASVRLRAGRMGLFGWDARTGRPVWKAAEPSFPWRGSLVPHPSKDLVLCVGQACVVLWDVQARKAEWELDLNTHDAVWGQGGRWLITLEQEGKSTLRDGRAGKPLREFVGQPNERPYFAASPIRREAAVVEADGTLAVFDPFTGKRRWKAEGAVRLSPGDKGILAFDSRGEWLLADGREGGVRLWRARDGKPGPVLGKGLGGCEAATIARGGLVGVGLKRGLVCVFNPATGKELNRWRTPGGLLGLAFSPDGQTVATWHEDCPRVLLWGRQSGKFLAPPAGTDEPLTGVEYAGEGKLITREWAGQAALWDVATGKAAQLPPRPFPVTGREWSRDGRFLAESDETGLWLLDTRTGKRRRLMKPTKGLKATFGFSRGGRWLAARFDGERERGLPPPRTLVMWDTATGKRGLAWGGSRGWEFSPDGKRLAVVVDGVGVVLADLERGVEKTLYRLPAWMTEMVGPPRWSGDSRRLFVDCGDWLATLDATEATAVRELPDLVVCTYGITELSPDGRLIAASEEQFSKGGTLSMIARRAWARAEIDVYSLETGQLLHTFRGHTGSVTGLAFSPRGDTLASCSNDGTAILWDMTGRLGRPCRLSAAAYARCWKALAGRDAPRAERALWDIACCPEAPALLRKAVRPQRGMPVERLKKWAGDLDSDDFETRSTAEAALRAHGPGATGALRQLAETGTTLEVRLRIERILRRWAAAPEARRLSRAVLVLEKSGSAEAKALLKELASGEAGAPLTEDAKAALKRLSK